MPSVRIAAERRARLARRDLERDAAQSSPGGREGRVVQRRRQAVPHRRPDHGRQPRVAPVIVTTAARGRGRVCTFASCCSSVTANAWLPSSSAST